MTQAPLTLPDLPYPYEALEPAISREIMEIHHKKHHAAYVTNYNKALEQYKEAEIKGDVALQIALSLQMKFNGGGHVNHSLFWKMLAPQSNGGGQLSEGVLKKAIESEFGSLDQFKELFTAKAQAHQGSGWCWLGYNKSMKRLEIATCDNQDPLSTKGLIPLLGIDVWEHAYYLQYKNVRPDYIKAFWTVVNWKYVEERYQGALSGA